jgi:hypothetical protein
MPDVPAVDALGACEDLLDPRPAPSHGIVEALLPLGQGMMLVGPEHQPRLDAPGSQPGTALVLVIGLVGVDRSTGQLAEADDRRALIDADMRLWPKYRLPVALGRRDQALLIILYCSDGSRYGAPVKLVS